jgi:hypothetical protein
MALTMRPAGLSSGIDKDRADYTVFCGEWNIGRIYEVRGGPEHLRWFWALHFPSKPENLRTDNRVATLEAAKAEFEASWRQWLAWAELQEMSLIVELRSRLRERPSDRRTDTLPSGLVFMSPNMARLQRG